jgi:galactonate dehydratase
MKIAKVETRHCDAGWRNYHFVKLTTETGVIGWSEFDEGFGSPGVAQVIEAMGAKILGLSVNDHERVYAFMYALTRPAAGGVVAEGLGAIENAMLDAKAKTMEVPCHALLGG